MRNPGLLMIGNYLSQPKHNRNIWNDLAERLAMNGWEVITTSRYENKALRLLDMLSKVLTQRKKYALAQIDVFSGTAFIFAEASAKLLSWLKKPIVLNLHGGGLPEFAQNHPGRVKALLHRARLVVTPSPFIQKGLSNFRQDIQVIPNPIDIYSTIFRERPQIHPRLIWVRAFHRVYNPVLAVKVLKKLSIDYPDVHLTMIGPDKGDGSLQLVMQKAQSLGVYERLTIIPGLSHDAIAGWMNQADIFLNTTNYDVAPRSVLEAMANGLCIVSTNVGGMPWLVADRLEGLLVPPDDPEAMTAAVVRILEDPKLAACLNAAARRKAESLDWPAIIPIWNTNLRSLL